MPEQPSQSMAKRTASAAESRTVQPMLCVQVRNMGTRLLWIWFCLIADCACVIGFGLRCGGSAISKSRQGANSQTVDSTWFVIAVGWRSMWVDSDSVDAETHRAGLWFSGNE